MSKKQLREYIAMKLEQARDKRREELSDGDKAWWSGINTALADVLNRLEGAN